MSKKLLFNFNREVIQDYTYVKYVGTIITATNTLEKPIKSAILKGNTLVNIFNNWVNNVGTLTPVQTQDGYFLFTGNNKYARVNLYDIPTFERGVEYTFIYRIKNSTYDGKNDNILRLDVGATAHVYVHDVTNGIWKIKKSFSTDETNCFVKVISWIGSTGSAEVSLQIIEGDYTNVDIPYFEGMQSVKMPVLTTTGKNTLNPNEITLDSSSHVNPESYTYSEGVYTFKNSRSNNQMRFTITKQNASDKILYEVLEVKDLNGNVTPHQITMEGSNDKAYWFSIIRPDWGNVGEVKIKLGVDSLEPYKSNILTVNEDVTLRSNGDICDELNLLTGQLTQRIGEDGVVLSQEVVKTVDLSILDQNENKVSSISSFNDTTHITASSETIPPIFEGYLATKEVE